MSITHLSLQDACYPRIGERMNPFERKKPWAVYITRGDSCSVVAETPLELAVCRAPGKGTYPSRLIRPQDIGAEARGRGNNRRFVHSILPDTALADSLRVVEVVDKLVARLPLS